MLRVSAALLALASLAFVLAAPGLAKRPPNPSERAGIRAAVEAFVHKQGTPAAKDNRIVRIKVSTVKRVWAAAFVNSPSAGPAVAILKRRAQGWKVVEFGSAIGCDAAPRAVLRDLIGGCEPG